MLHEIFRVGKPIITALHLPPLPGSLRFKGNLEEIIEFSVTQARILEESGADGIIIENYNDYPYPKRLRNPITLAAMTTIVREVVKEVSIPVGVNVLRNSSIESYCIAYATGAKFIRVNAFVEVLVTDSGTIEPTSQDLAPIRAQYPGIKVFADILCKHGASLSYTTLLNQLRALNWMGISAENAPRKALEVIIKDAEERGLADALIVTGTRTGESPDLNLVKTVKKLSKVPVIIGSGLTPENIENYLKIADGAIVGSYIRKDGKAGNPIDRERLKRFMRAVKEAHQKI